jgi:cyclopropane fatty-acyl-phospholipid synthase-like methyltransferase
MKFERDTDAEVFNAIWPGGYEESFEGYTNNGVSKYSRNDIENLIRPFYNKEHVCLEIGCGGGMWTRNYLVPNFKHVICLDVVPKKFKADCTYIQLANKDFFCSGVEDNSIDFVFSYGVFCHLSSEAQEEYLKNLFHKMKSGAQAFILFANFDRHPDHMNQNEEYIRQYKQTNVSPNGGSWFYMDLDLCKKIITKAGFSDFQDLIPDFRDTLAYFRKN